VAAVSRIHHLMMIRTVARLSGSVVFDFLRKSSARRLVLTSYV
jgi:hypothetical protein